MKMVISKYTEITVLERNFLPQHYWLPIPRSEIIKSNYTLGTESLL